MSSTLLLIAGVLLVANGYSLWWLALPFAVRWRDLRLQQQGRDVCAMPQAHPPAGLAAARGVG